MKAGFPRFHHRKFYNAPRLRPVIMSPRVRLAIERETMAVSGRYSGCRRRYPRYRTQRDMVIRRHLLPACLLSTPHRR